MTEDGLDVRNALATSEELLRQTLEGTQTGSWWWDIATNVVSWSDNLGPIHGLPRGTQPAGYEDYLELVHPDDRAAIAAAVQESLAAGTGYEIEFRSATPDGVVKWIWARATVLLDGEGKPARIVGLTRDVTERRRAAEREAVLGRLAPLLERVTGPQELADELAELLVEELADWCSVTIDASGQTGNAVAHSRRAAGELAARLAVPLQARGHPVGEVLLAAGLSTRRYDEDDEALLAEIGRAVGGAVERLRLDRAVESARRDADVSAEHATRLQQVTAGLAAAATTADIAEVIVEHGMRALRARTAVIGVLETPGELRFLRAEGYGTVFPERLGLDEPWPITTAVRTGRLVELGDLGARRTSFVVPERVWEASGQGRLVAVPLVGRGGPIGALGFTREGPEPLTPEERRLVETLATQTALALERASLFEAHQLARLRAEGLQRVTSAVATAATIEELADAVALEALEVLDVVGVTVVLARSEDDTVADVLASRGLAERHARAEPTVDLRSETITADTIRSQESQFAETPDEIAERWPASAAVAQQLGVGAIASTPIQVAERGGVLSVVAPARRFPPEERTFLRLLARALEHGLVRAALYEAEREAHRRSEVLQRLSTALSRALVPADVGSAFLDHALAAVDASSGAVVVADERGEQLVTVAVAEARDRAVRWPASVGVGSDHTYAAAYRTGEPVAAVGDEQLAGYAATAALLADGGGVGAYAQPLVAGGKAIGAFVLCFDTEAPVAPADARLLMTMSRVCAQAIERANLYESEHLIALRLQRALLPETVAQYPGLRIAARYRAGAEAMEVGGDWYHTFELADGRVAMSVGDVVGRGIEAAAAMGRLRSALAAFALDDMRPGRLVSRLDRFAVGPGGVEIATASYAVADPVTGILRYASAGHPPMLVVAPSGETRWLTAGQSPPLGADVAEDSAEAVEVLEPGSLLIAYSDGLVERRGEGIDTGLARLERLARELAEHSVDEICDRILDELCDAGDEDDVVILALRREPVAGRPFAHGFPARREEIGVCRSALRHWLTDAGVATPTREDVLLAVHEALANAVEHAYLGTDGEVRVCVAVADGVVAATVADDGTWRPPTEGDPSRGRGRTLIEALAHQSSLTTSPAGTTVAMRFHAVAEPVAG